MADDFRPTWDDIAHNWNDWGPPLRRSDEDRCLTLKALALWHATNPIETVEVFQCGVTPEIATMQWPFATHLTAMDLVENMVRVVWPGDIPGVRAAVVGNWMVSGLPPHSQDVVIGDGGFVFFDYPVGQRALLGALSGVLHPRGLFVYRHFAQSPEPERLGDVMDALRAGAIGNFHVFKWRVAMALQRESCGGVVLHDVWQAVADAGLNPAHLPQPGFSARAIGTIRFYRDRDARLYFPTLDEFTDLLAEVFDRIEVQVPQYELGERCPILTARPRCSSR